MQNRDTHLIWEAYANTDRLLNENFINKLKEKFGNFTAETVAPYVREALQKLKQEDSKTYNEIGAAVKNNDLNKLKKIAESNGIHQEGVLDDLKDFGKEGGKALVAGAKEAGKLAYKAGKGAIKGTHNWLGKKLGQGKRGLLYIIMIAVALLIALGGSQPASEYEGFKDIEIEMVAQDQGQQSQHVIDQKIGDTHEEIVQDYKSGKISKEEAIRNMAKIKTAQRGRLPSSFNR